MLFVLILLGVAFFHHYTMYVALAGVVVVTAYTGFLCPDFTWSPDQILHSGKGLARHFLYEGEETLLNLGGLLLGFALLAKFFEHSGVPDNLPRLLPKSKLWSGFVLLAIVWFISSFLDNIAAAMIGGVIAKTAYKGRVTRRLRRRDRRGEQRGRRVERARRHDDHDDVARRRQPVRRRARVRREHRSRSSSSGSSRRSTRTRSSRWSSTRSPSRKPIDYVQLLIVAADPRRRRSPRTLFNGARQGFFAGGPWYGVWAAILVGALLRKPAWGELPGAAKGAVFLLSLVWCASLMPVKALPRASWQTAFGLGFVSAVFDNIPLTKLALEQGGYDWGALAFTVGFGGSMIWFGSSAGVAISKDFPEARNTGRYIKEGWPVAVAYVVAFFVFLGVMGFHPHAPHKARERSRRPRRPRSSRPPPAAAPPA